MRYRLRTLLILLAVGPMAIWAAWLLWESIRPTPEPPEPVINYGHKMQMDVF